MRRVACGLLIGAASLAPLAIAHPVRAASSQGTFTRHRFRAADPNFSRDYWLYEPARRARPTPLVVFLHGCVQTDAARESALATGWNSLAAKRGFLVVYPEQRVSPDAEPNAQGWANGTGCWNWFRPENHQRGSAELATISGITRRVVSGVDIDPRLVFLAGFSAGANMAVNLAATYPDLYAAMGVLAGCAFRSCSDAGGRFAFEAMGSRARTMPVFVAQGTVDHLNNPAMAEGLVRQWLGTNDLADNGAMDGSVPRAPAAVERHGFDGSLVEGIGQPGDTCLRPMRWGCPGGWLGLKDSYPYTVERYVDAKGRSLVEFWIIHGLMHAYPRGHPDAQFTDPLGPDFTKASYVFFMSHPKTGS